MSAVPVAEDRSAQIYCVLIALNDDTLLLPNAAIAETVGQDGLTEPADAPAWVAGTFEWNHRSLTALRFETLNGAGPQALTRRARLVVLQALDVQISAAPLALVAQSYPHLITVTREAITSLPLREGDDPRFVLARVRVGNGEALIPNLDALRECVDGLSPLSTD